MAVPCSRARAQETPGLADRQSAPLTLRTDTRLTVEDVVVTDASGKAVEGLPQSAFHVTDDGNPQSIRSFEESKVVKQSAAPAVKPGVLSNAAMMDANGNVNVILLDPIGVEVADQMFLRLQARKYLESMPAGTAMAVFRTSRDGRPLLVQSTTQERALLMKAIDNSVPTFAVSVPANEVFFNAIGELSNIAEYLGQMKGRKSLIWFAGQFPLAQVLGGNGAQQASEFDEMQEAMKSVYRKLEAARVAVFPVDVRGVVNASINVNLPVNPDPTAASSPTIIAGQAAEQQGSWAGMDALASATGGHAYYSDNALAQQLRSAVDLGRHFYTLAYSPTPYAEDGAWHKVTVTVDGGYTVSYREGYFAVPSAEQQRMEAAKTRNKGKYTVAEAPPNVPIVFQAEVRSEETHGTNVSIRYAIQAKDLSFRAAADGTEQARFKVAALGYDGSGLVKSKDLEDVTTHFSKEQMRDAQRVGVPAVQTVGVAKGAKYLLLTVIDLETGRTGTVQMAVDSLR